MDYMILIYSDENAPMPDPGTPEFQEYMASWMQYNQDLHAKGHYVAGTSLEPTSTASTIRRTLGAEPIVTDGPFAETKEALGGWYHVRAKDLDEALALAMALPLPAGSIEVRPIGIMGDPT